MPVLFKLTSLRPKDVKAKIVDTLLWSQFLNPERVGGHSLAAWGERLGYPKGDFTDFTQYSDEMLEYCKQDVRVNYQILRALEKEYGDTIQGYSIY